MLTKIHNELWIDLDSIYLVDYDEYSNDLVIYINQHPKVPITLKDEESIIAFQHILENYYRSRTIKHEQQTSTAKNVTEASQNSMEQFNP